jgi:hypothetical protein
MKDGDTRGIRHVTLPAKMENKVDETINSFLMFDVDNERAQRIQDIQQWSIQSPDIRED